MVCRQNNVSGIMNHMASLCMLSYLYLSSVSDYSFAEMNKPDIYCAKTFSMTLTLTVPEQILYDVK